MILHAIVISGMAVNNDCKLKILKLKAKRTCHFIVFMIDEKLKEVIIEKIREPTLGYEKTSPPSFLKTSAICYL